MLEVRHKNVSNSTARDRKNPETIQLSAEWVRTLQLFPNLYTEFRAGMTKEPRAHTSMSPNLRNMPHLAC